MDSATDKPTNSAVSTAVTARAGQAPGFEAFRHRHSGESILVCGCGESLQQLDPSITLTTIGVNDVGRRFTPTYLVVLNPEEQFSPERFSYIRHTGARAVFTQFSGLPVPADRRVPLRLGRYGGTDFSDPDRVHYTQNSPYVAVNIAVHMGAKRIGLIGVDFGTRASYGATVRHPLQRSVDGINAEYAGLAAACAREGIELFNLSPSSKLTALPRMALAEFLDSAPVPAEERAVSTAQSANPAILLVDYDFVTCGRVFGEGLARAAASMGARTRTVLWSDPGLPALVDRLQPDLMVVIHGRAFAERWNNRFKRQNTAVWLLDEPYEVDDTSQWSRCFETVFVNDRATLSRHGNAHYLPVCYDAVTHRESAGPRPYRVGFVGGANAMRERYLGALASAGLLDYVVGGPWSFPALQKLVRAGKVSPAQVTHLYQSTQLIINVFRDVHHFNRRGVAATAPNPRVFEAIACGAALLSEKRPGMEEIFPELPQFESPEELVALVRHYLTDAGQLVALKRQCRARVEGHAYGDRLGTMLQIALPRPQGARCAGAYQGAIAVHLPTPVRIEGAGAAMHPRPSALPPLAPATVRHLIYHVWPKHGSNWRWNIEQLLARMDLFNGRRVIGIVEDQESEPATAVMDLLAGHGCEFRVRPNGAAGEALSFPGLLHQVASVADDEVTFYGHAKGVKYGDPCPANVRRWSETLYRTALDDWPRVRDHLDRLAMTGSFRMSGRFASHRHAGDWHYSGTFFWMRNAAVFARAWQQVPEFYYAVEAWPGSLCRREETGCLFIDNLGTPLPYLDDFWRRRGNQALHNWEARRRDVSIPPDLANPCAFDGFAHPRLEHKPAEFEWWLAQLRARGVRRLLTVGSASGGPEWHTARIFREAGLDIDITTIEPHPAPDMEATFEEARTRFGQRMRLLVGSPRDPALWARLEGRFDAVFIDGDHRYGHVHADFVRAKALHPKLIGLHDIVDSDWHAATKCCVSRLWRELVAQHHTREKTSGAWAGIGVVHLDESGHPAGA